MLARENPFAVEHLHRLKYQLEPDEWPMLLDRLNDLDYRAAIVGPQGAGKTTLLLELRLRLEQRGFQTTWFQLHAGDRRLPTEVDQALRTPRPTPHVLCLDGAEQLSPRAWRRLLRQTRQWAGLIITVHRPQRLPTLHDCQTSPELLHRLVEQLIERQSASLPWLERALLDELFARHAGNLRLVLRELYDRCAGL